MQTRAQENGANITDKDSGKDGAWMSDSRGGGSWDDPLEGIEFEEFALQEPEDWEVADESRTDYSADSYLTCPSCGGEQRKSNRHCEQCGARLGQQQIAVAAPPLRSVTAGGRALGIIVVAIALVVIAALVIQAIRGEEQPAEVVAQDQTASGSTTTATTQALGPLERITPISITCSSEYNANLACENLLDNRETYWNDAGLKGEDAWIEVTFVSPVALESVQIQNVRNEEKFRRNYRVRAVEIETDDLPGVPFVAEVDNTNERPLPITTSTNHTLELTIRVTATYASESLGGDQAFDELAIEELVFWGRVQDSATPQSVDLNG